MGDKNDIKKYQQFGEIDMPGGALVVFNSLEGLAQIKADMARYKLHKLGVLITPDIEARIQQFEKDVFIEIKTYIESQGVASYFKQLFNAQKKSEAEQIANSIMIKHRDFSHLAFNCEQIGFTRLSKYPKHLPKHLVPTDAEREALNRSKTGPLEGLALNFFNKIRNLFRERRCVSAHMFSKGAEWHCFYFSYEDVFGSLKDGANHWQYGDHVHYVSHLWGLRKDEVWQSLDNRKTSFKNIHIKYEPDKKRQ